MLKKVVEVAERLVLMVEGGAFAAAELMRHTYLAPQLLLWATLRLEFVELEGEEKGCRAEALSIDMDRTHLPHHLHVATAEEQAEGPWVRLLIFEIWARREGEVEEHPVVRRRVVKEVQFEQEDWRETL
jgi:hypothetical protein